MRLLTESNGFQNYIQPIDRSTHVSIVACKMQNVYSIFIHLQNAKHLQHDNKFPFLYSFCNDAFNVEKLSINHIF